MPRRNSKRTLKKRSKRRSTRRMRGGEDNAWMKWIEEKSNWNWAEKQLYITKYGRNGPKMTPDGEPLKDDKGNFIPKKMTGSVL